MTAQTKFLTFAKVWSVLEPVCQLFRFSE